MDGKMSPLYNTTLEVSLRVLIILARSKEAQSVEEISAIDFLSVYGREFNIGDRNLHGDNIYMYGEAAARHERIQAALGELALRGLSEINPSKNGFRYSATSAGCALCETLDSSFALEFGKYAELAMEEIKINGLHCVQNMIAEKAKLSIRRDTNA